MKEPMIIVYFLSYEMKMEIQCLLMLMWTFGLSTIKMKKFLMGQKQYHRITLDTIQMKFKVNDILPM